jgi:hypothetical protein
MFKRAWSRSIYDEVVASVPVVLVVLLLRFGRCTRRLRTLLCRWLWALRSLRAWLRGGLGALLLRTLLRRLWTLLCGLRTLRRLRALRRLRT